MNIYVVKKAGILNEERILCVLWFECVCVGKMTFVSSDEMMWTKFCKGKEILIEHSSTAINKCNLKRVTCRLCFSRFLIYKNFLITSY